MESNNISEVRSRWLVASEHALNLSAELFQPGFGYGDPQERLNDEQCLRSAREEAEPPISGVFRPG